MRSEITGNEYILKLLDSDRVPMGEITEFISFNMTQRFNDVGDWELIAPASNLSMLGWGATVAPAIELTRNGEVIFTGPLAKINRKWDKDQDLITASGFDDLYYLSTRICLPDPTMAPSTSPQTFSSAFDVYPIAGNPEEEAEKVIRYYVNYNAGPSAYSTRVVPNLTLASQNTPAVGHDTRGYARFDNLLKFCQNLSKQSIDISDPDDLEVGFKVLSMEFSCYEVSDKTSEVVFSEGLGNIESYNYDLEIPKSNYIWAGGSGEDENRIFYSYGDTTSISTYGQIEGYKDAKKVSSLADLQAEIIEQLAKDANKETLEVIPIVNVGLPAYDSYWVGDRVSVYVDSTQIKNVIREATLSLTAEGEHYKLQIGTPELYQTGLSRLYFNIRDSKGRINSLERRT